VYVSVEATESFHLSALWTPIVYASIFKSDDNLKIGARLSISKLWIAENNTLCLPMVQMDDSGSPASELLTSPAFVKVLKAPTNAAIGQKM